MSNRRELRNARNAVTLACETLGEIERLPRQKGSLIVWTNGVVWRRLGDDEWESLHRNEQWKSDPIYGTFTSAHVATSAGTFNPITKIKHLPNLEGSAE